MPSSSNLLPLSGPASSKRYLLSRAMYISPALVLNSFITTGVLHTVLALPAPQAGNGRPINNDDVPGIPIGPSGASGSIYGSETLLGNGDNPVDTGNTAIVSDYPTVPGQDADADIGLFLDFAAVDNAQSIRGSNGATDPGPRM